MKRFNYLTLAALVALAACDEGVDPVVAPVTGTIVGAVTIEAEAAAGVSVTLSSGPTATTDAEGAFQFDEVATGSCTVTISDFADDATFTSTFKAATISSAGQVVTANFDGSFVRTSAIIGSVQVGGDGIPRCVRRYRWHGRRRNDHRHQRCVLRQRSPGRELHRRDVELERGFV